MEPKEGTKNNIESKIWVGGWDQHMEPKNGKVVSYPQLLYYLDVRLQVTLNSQNIIIAKHDFKLSWVLICISLF